MRRLGFLFLLLPFFLSAEEMVIDLQELGKIVYHFEDGLCEKIVRLAPSGQVKYEHLYNYDQDGKFISESLIGHLGNIHYSGSMEEGFITAHTPFGDESWLKEDRGTFEMVNIEKSYDEAGHLTQKGADHFFYDNDQLIRVDTDQYRVYFAYDEEGRRIAKKTISEHGEEDEYYLYWGKNEIGSVSEDGKLNWLRIPGMTNHPNLVRAIAVETEDAVYAPIYDARWNIVKLVNIEDRTIIEIRPDAFGQNLKELKGCPWIFCSKRFDRETGLVDFGFRR